MSNFGYVLGPLISLIGTVSVYLCSFILASESKELFGQYSEFIFLMNIFVASASLSIDIQMVRSQISGEKNFEPYYFQIGLLVNFFLSTVYVLSLSILSLGDYLFSFLIIIFQFVIVFVSGLFQMRKFYIWMSVTLNITNIVRLVFISLMVFYSEFESVSQIVNGYILIHLFTLIFSLLCFCTFFQSENKIYRFVRSDWTASKFKGLVLLAIAPVLHMIIYQSDIVVLSQSQPVTIVAEYGLALTIVTAIYYFPSLVSNKYMLPYLLKIGEGDKVERKPVLYYAFFSIVFVFLVFSLTDTVYEWFFAKYSNSTFILKLLLIGVFFRLLSIPLGSALNAERKVKKKIIVMAFIAFFNLLANYIFIPQFGVKAAIYTTVISELMLFSLYSIIIKL
ncbi:TPA: polysaccharide biosynthesis C-terminal domain-containing protein [Vibrio alginolyticus]|uniref:polysaccharide biosynthesis C-terminal domain-containing protein n=1 Tax=Vibrio alginolyticus TaxID=663 RepID=UPI001BD5926D|nr:polysaccharide biosynthesis C-terminal domain-containing protein [Vibrio alginolyticus]MBS9933711.1 polysaccharide biosynthesis C-terminal domain-containing protein [Vibrio alginolyticus]MBS9983820.1 polysaccharide biosynthesis C-terminal domain-containing protein [Vibrio alginolyticus]MBT0057560.1 polysaccharide biosynthesis C-terminal domain-containing protein [Vibrio alginolyticus]MBT0108408.1 polysaccharide biosynthesis C-terminal domain-containing protein [Vibrio alginolyticus]MCQ90881